MASWGFSRGPSSLENFCLIMEVRSHRTPFRSFPSHSGQIMKACLRPGPSTCLSLPPPPTLPCTHLAPATRLLCYSSSRPSTLLLRSYAPSILFAPAPLALCMADFGRTGILSVERPSPPVSPHPSAFVKCLIIFIPQQIVRSMRMGDVLRFVHCCVAPSPAQKSAQ